MSAQPKRVAFHRPRFLSVPARLANRFGLVTPVQVIEGAARDIRDNVLRNLDNHFSGENSPELGSREIEINQAVENTLPPNNNNNIIEVDGLDVNRTSVERVAVRRNYSPVSYDSSIFEANNEENMQRNPLPSTVPPENVDREIERLRAQARNNAAADYEDAGRPLEDPSNALIIEIMQIVREIQEEIRELHEQIHDLRANREDLNRTRTIPNDTNLDVTYGRTLNDVRNQSAPLNGNLRLKEARDMIPEFDGNSQAKLKEFLSACSYAIKNINPADEKTLLEAILCTKLKGKAMVDFETRNINSFGQFKRELEICYLSKKSITHLQIEFNSLKQKGGESARAYGLRADNLAMELYESMIEGQDYGSERKRIILETIQQQALQNFQIGLHDDIKLVVRAQHYSTLQEAIAGANAEEKVKGPLEHASRHKPDYTISQAARNKVSQCHKCGKLGHHGRECRTSRYSNRFSLPKPQGPSRINILEKHCTYCKKSGHCRDECWSLHGRPGIVQSNRTKSNEDKKPQNRNNTNGQRRKNKTQNEDEEEDEENTRQPRPALEYQISQVTGKSQTKTGLDLVTLPIQEVKKGKLNLLFDTGATVTLMKLRNLKGETMIYEEQMALTGVTGHKMNTIGKIKATIILKNRKIRHSIYIVKDDFPIDYEGILGVDFLQKHKVTCDYNKKQIQLSDTILKLYPYRALILKPRSETIIQATTDSNKVGIIRAEETQPGVFIGYCLVKPEEFSCPISVINTTEEYIKLPTPCVTVEEIKNTAAQICITQAQQKATTLSRREQIKNLLRVQHLNQEEVKTLLEICEGFSDIFYIEGDALTYTPTITHEITVQANSAPVNIRPYRLPEKHKLEVNQQVKGMLRDKIIRPSTSQWNAPLLVVPKKTDASGKQKLRIVVDFRKLNDLTIGDSFPLPNITDILDQLGNAKYFTTLDLASGYHQIPVSENDKCKTAFSTPYGHNEFNRMPFGLKNAPATFQRLMNSVLTGIQGIKCLVYLDDIVIYGASLKEHNTRLIEVLNKLRKHNLKLQPDKCEFLRKEVIYLGHIVTENGIMPDPSKLKAVREFPIPTKVKEIQSFIGLAGYYRKFIENFSKIAKPLTKLTKKGEKFEWVGEQQNAFETLKNKLITAPVLKYPDFSQEFLLTTDASDYAIGAILSQGEVGQDRPIAYASRILSRAEHNYNTTEKELLAIVWAVKYYRPYLYGTKFKIITDHKPLVWLFNVADPGSRLIRWRLKLEEYDYEIVHRSGKTNTNADVLSRNVVLNLKEEKEENYNEKRDYSEEDKARILYEYHDAPLGGHQGIERTINRIRMKHNWSGLTKYVENYIAKCEFCQKNKLKRKSKAPLVITDTASRPFEKCALDIVGPLTVTNNGNKYVLTFQDNLTKFSKAVPLPNQEAATVAKEFVIKIIFEHGIPDKVLTDQGTNFLSDMFKNMCKLLKIEKIQTTAYHPESNGALERSHRTLAEYLRHYINADQTDWDEWIPYAMFTYNTTPHTATGFTPFELVYGHQAILPTALTTPPKPTYTYDNYAQELKERIRATNQIAKEHIREEKIKVKEQYDKRAKQTTFKVGDKVLLHDETVRRGRSKKLDSLWIGPYIITDKISDVNYKIKNIKGRKNVTNKHLFSRTLMTWKAQDIAARSSLEAENKIEQFKQEPGIYFEKIGDLHQVESSWKLVINIDMGALNKRFHDLQNYIDHALFLGNLQNKAQETCQTLKGIIEADNEKLAQLLRRVNTIYRTPTDKRRGLINGIGSLAKTLFGTMDANDEKIIKEQLTLLENQEQTLHHTMKNQVKILNATIAHIDNLEKVTQYNEQLLLNFTSKIQKQLTSQIQREEIHEHFYIINAIITDLMRDTEDIIQHLMAIKDGKIHPRLIPLEQVIDSLKEATSQVPQGLHFPFGIFENNWLTIEKFITISAYYDTPYIHTILRFPLISHPKYNIVKAIPLPIYSQGNLFTFVEINQPIIAIDSENQNYLTTTQNKLDKCIEISNHYICEQNRPIYHINDDSLCEIQAYLQVAADKRFCNTRYIHSNHTIWIALTNQHSWLYSTLTEQSITISCENQEENRIKISKTGRITLINNCKLVTADMIIKTSGVIDTTYLPTYLPEYNISNLKFDLSNTSIKPNVVKLKKIIQNPNELMDLSTRLQEITKELDKTNNYPFLQKQVIYPISGSLAILIISIIVIILWRAHRNCKRTPRIE